MELKSYQKEVIADLARYLELVVELQSPAKAYQALWNAKNVLVGFGGMPNYVNVLSGVPHVCTKVPTGGGKTYIAASSLRTIFDAMPQRRAKAVVWLVPSEAILTQTRRWKIQTIPTASGWMWILAGGYRCTPRSKPSWGRTLPLLR